MKLCTSEKNPIRNETDKKKTSLIASERKLTTLEILDEYTSLRILDLRNNALSEINPVGNHKNLTSLYLQSNKISSLEGFQNLRSLEVLFLDFNSIEVVENLEHCPLKILSIRGQKLCCGQMLIFDPLTSRNIKGHLLELYISKNNWQNIQQLQNSKKLRTLDISSNDFSDLYGLAVVLETLLNLQFLDVSHNKVTKNPDFKMEIITKCKNLVLLNSQDIPRTERLFYENIGTKKRHSEPIPFENQLIHAIQRSSVEVPYGYRPRITQNLLKELERKRNSIKQKKAFVNK